MSQLRKSSLTPSQPSLAFRELRLGKRVFVQQASETASVAEARERLLATAERWGAPLRSSRRWTAIITHAATGRSVRYGQVAARGAASASHPATIKINSAREFSLMGTERKSGRRRQEQ